MAQIIDMRRRGGGSGASAGGSLDIGASTPAAPLVGAERVYLLDTQQYATVADIALAHVVPAPAYNAAVGRIGQVAFDATYDYSCYAANAWRRVNRTTGVIEMVFGTFNPVTDLGNSRLFWWDAQDAAGTAGYTPVTMGSGTTFTALNSLQGDGASAPAAVAHAAGSGWADFGTILNNGHAVASFDVDCTTGTQSRCDGMAWTCPSEAMTFACVYKPSWRTGGQWNLLNNSATGASYFQPTGNAGGSFSTGILGFDTASANKLTYTNGQVGTGADGASRWGSIVMTKAAGIATAADVAVGGKIRIYLNGVELTAWTPTFGTAANWANWFINRVGYHQGLAHLSVTKGVMDDVTLSRFVSWLHGSNGRWVVGGTATAA